MTTKSNMILIMIMSHVKHKLFRLRGRKVSTGIMPLNAANLTLRGPKPQTLQSKPEASLALRRHTESHEAQKTMSQEGERHR